MKSTNKKYLLGFSFLICLALGIVFGKHIIARVFSPDAVYEVGPSAAYLGGGVPVYAQEASNIIIGVVKAIGVPQDNNDGRLVVQQEVSIDVKEVLKGDALQKSVRVFMDATRTPDRGFISEVDFKPGEKVLLFFGGDGSGHYAVFSGPAGKYLLDENNDVISSGGEKLSLADMRVQISNAMKAPPIIKHNIDPVPYSGEISPKQAGANSAMKY